MRFVGTLGCGSLVFAVPHLGQAECLLAGDRILVAGLDRTDGELLCAAREHVRAALLLTPESPRGAGATKPA